MSQLVVKATHADDAPERAHLACNVAAVAVASGVDVHLFLAVEGVRLAVPGVAEGIDVPEGAPLADLLDSLYAGATVTVCTPCATRRGLTAADLRDGTVLAGSARFVELVTQPDTQALVY